MMAVVPGRTEGSRTRCMGVHMAWTTSGGRLSKRIMTGRATGRGTNVLYSTEIINRRPRLFKESFLFVLRWPKSRL